ncbi:MAG: helix-turn-helix domain-containing protein, partial [Candidatus Sumerlaeia bacterium]
EPISVDDMARAAHLSKYHFIRKFREQTGLTPKRFLNEIRLEAAEHLLLQSDMTNETIAQQVGFPDASYFSHVYRRHRGHPPGALRANRRDAAITP